MQKKGQIYIILFILILAIAIFFFLRITKPDADADRADIGGEVIKKIEENLGFQGVRDPIDLGKSKFSFEGFGPGKSHEGQFDEWNGDIFIEDGKIIGFEGKIQTNSVNTDISKLDEYLKNEDFFNIDKYPAIKFISRDLKNNQLVGDLTFLGRTNEISFPVIISDESISADFIIDTSLFGEMSDLANDEVRIFFELVK
jgi:hypothetical protein